MKGNVDLTNFEFDDEAEKKNRDDAELFIKQIPVRESSLIGKEKCSHWGGLEGIVKNVNVRKTEVKSENDLVIYSLTFNMKGLKPSKSDMALLLPKVSIPHKHKYNMYVISSQECMRTIFMSFFNDEMGEWLSMIQ